jgi:hypothetical protein
MTPRVTLRYGEGVYIVGGRTAEDVRAEVSGMIESGRPGWLEVNFGEGRPTPAHLLITAGVTLSVQEDPAPDA